MYNNDDCKNNTTTSSHREIERVCVPVYLSVYTRFWYSFNLDFLCVVFIVLVVIVVAAAVIGVEQCLAAFVCSV